MIKTEELDKIAKGIEDSVNVMGSDSNDSMSYLVDKMLWMHRTLNQSFTSKFILQFIKRMAENFEKNCYDARNESACKICWEIWGVLKNTYGDEIYLPLI